MEPDKIHLVSWVSGEKQHWAQKEEQNCLMKTMKRTKLHWQYRERFTCWRKACRTVRNQCKISFQTLSKKYGNLIDLLLCFIAFIHTLSFAWRYFYLLKVKFDDKIIYIMSLINNPRESLNHTKSNQDFLNRFEGRTSSIGKAGLLSILDKNI